MYWVKILDMVKKMNISEEELSGVSVILGEAMTFHYSRDHYWPSLADEDVIKFKIENSYIEQSEILTALGIEVEPRKWRSKYTYCEEVVDFGPLWDFYRIVDVKETWVTFPLSLLTIDNEKDIKMKLKKKSKKNNEVEHNFRKIRVLRK